MTKRYGRRRSNDTFVYYDSELEMDTDIGRDRKEHIRSVLGSITFLIGIAATYMTLHPYSANWHWSLRWLAAALGGWIMGTVVYGLAGYTWFLWLLGAAVVGIVIAVFA